MRTFQPVQNYLSAKNLKLGQIAYRFRLVINPRNLCYYCLLSEERYCFLVIAVCSKNFW